MSAITLRQRQGHAQQGGRLRMSCGAAVLGGVIALGAVTVLSWMPHAPLDAPPNAAQPGASTSLATTAARTPAARPARTARTASTPSAATSDALNAPASSHPAADNETRICGLGAVRVDDDAPLPQDHIPAATRESARRSLDHSMITHPDVRTRAAALLMRVRLGLSGDALTEAREQDAACRFARIDGTSDVASFCAADAARRQAELIAPLLPSIDQLARLAASSDDPVLRGFAQEACEPHGLNHIERPESCQLAGAAAWARTTPNAAEPWLLLAAQAQERGDPAAAAQALAHAAQSRQVDAGAGALIGLATRALPASLPPLEQASAQADLAVLDDGFPAGALAAVNQLCHVTELDDAARRADCGALAHLMTGQGRAAGTVTAGVQLGERLGWSAEHTSDIVRDQREALDARQRYVGVGGGLSCESLERRRKLAALTAQVGEIEAGRRLAAR